MDKTNKYSAKLWQQSLKGYCQKIVNGISDLKVGDFQRAFWELVQNARDFSEDDCVIEICLQNDEITFAHQGKPFNVDSLGALVMQNSSKQSNDTTMVGQYGTGFMITHIFNHIVHVSSIFEDVDEDTNEVSYYSFKDFKIDRSAKTPEELCPVMQNALDLISEIPSSHNQLNDKKGRTIFTYKLTDEKATQVDAIWEEIRNYVPVVMLFNKSITEISIENKIRHTKYIYNSANEHRNQISEIVGWQKAETRINMHSLGKEECMPIILHSLQSDDEQNVIVIPPYPDYLSNINDVPSLFLSFPLLGTEHFGVNFIFHSNGFYPVEERNGIMLPRESSQYPEKPQENVKILKQMFGALFAYYSNPINAATLPIDCCRVEFLNNQTSQDKELDGFYSQMHELWVKNICTWKVIEGDNNERVSIDENNVRVLESAFYDKLDKDTSHYEEIIAKYASKVKLTTNEERIILPKSDLLIGWSKVVNGWVKDNKEYVVTLKEVCESIKEKTDDLHSFLQWVNEIQRDDLMQDYALIPNREGTLCLRNKLRSGQTISEELYQLVRPLLKEKLDCLIDEQYKDLHKFDEYSRSDLQKDLIAKMAEMRKLTVNAETPTPLEQLKLGQDTIYALSNYCYTFSSESTISLRTEIMPIICELYDFNIERKTIPNEGELVNGRAVDIYDSAFTFLLDDTIFALSKKDASWVQDNKGILLKFLTKLKNKSSEKEFNDRVINRAVFPNKNGNMSLFNSLKTNISNGKVIVDNEFAQEYNALMNHDLKDDWVDDEFGFLMDFKEEQPIELGRKLEEIFEPYLEEKRRHSDDESYQCNTKYEKSLLTIVHHLEKGKWHNYFDHFVSRLHEISFELGSKKQKEDLYTIKMNISDEKTLHDIAELSKNPDFCNIIKSAQEQIEQEKEKIRQFQFTFAIGKQIEDAIRNEVSNELSVEFCNRPEQVTTKDEQGGQDIIIRDKEGNNLYYIECKAKWNFHDDPKAHMSSLQIKQAVKNQDKYALLCVDCTRDTGAKIDKDASRQEVINSLPEILSHTTAHCDIGKSFYTPIGALVKYEEEFKEKDGEQNIKLNSIVGCDIPKSIFNNGIPFDEFMHLLKVQLKEETLMDINN